jgi:hypothetical protein
VQVDQVLRAVDDLTGEDVGNPLRNAAVGLSGEDAVQVLVVSGRVVDGAAEERRHVRHVDHQDRARQLLRVDRRPEPLQREDRRVLCTVRARDESEHGARLRAVHDRKRDDRARVGSTRRNLELPVGGRSGLRGHAADGDRRLGIGGWGNGHAGGHDHRPD